MSNIGIPHAPMRHAYDMSSSPTEVGMKGNEGAYRVNSHFQCGTKAIGIACTHFEEIENETQLDLW